MENEIMNVEETEIMDEVVVTDNKRFGAGKVALIGAAVVLAVTAGVKLVKKGIAAHKAKKAACQNDEVCEEETE